MDQRFQKSSGASSSVIGSKNAFSKYVTKSPQQRRFNEGLGRQLKVQAAAAAELVKAFP